MRKYILAGSTLAYLMLDFTFNKAANYFFPDTNSFFEKYSLKDIESLDLWNFFGVFLPAMLIALGLCIYHIAFKLFGKLNAKRGLAFATALATLIIIVTIIETKYE